MQNAMYRKMVMRSLLLLLLLFATCVLLYACTQVKRVNRKADRNLTTSLVLPMNQDTLIKAIRNAFREIKTLPANKFSRFSLAQAGEESFPAEYQLTHYRNDESIARYLAIAPERRKLDFYLYDFSDADNHGSYWASEYYRGAEPVPFRCNFVIHHEPEGPTATKVEVFEYAPRVWLGKKFALDRHGPGYIVDTRTVAPTTSDRIDVLDLIKEATRR